MLEHLIFLLKWYISITQIELNPTGKINIYKLKKIVIQTVQFQGIWTGNLSVLEICFENMLNNKCDCIQSIYFGELLLHDLLLD